MTIPSSVLFCEIKQMGFGSKPYLNEFDEVCIGFGHRLIDDLEFISRFDEDLAKAIASFNNIELNEVSGQKKISHQQKLNKKLLHSKIEISLEDAETLLQQELISYYTILVEKSSGFRRLINLCHGNLWLGKTQLAKSLEKCKSLELRLIKGKTSKSNANRNHLSKKPNSSNLQNANYKNVNTSSSSSSKKRNSFANYEILRMPNGVGDAALIRLDTIIHLSHILGIKKLVNMGEVFLALSLDDYHSASSFLLTHPYSQTLKSKMVLFARRLRYGFMYCEIDEPLPLEAVAK